MKYKIIVLYPARVCVFPLNRLKIDDDSIITLLNSTYYTVTECVFSLSLFLCAFLHISLGFMKDIDFIDSR